MDQGSYLTGKTFSSKTIFHQVESAKVLCRLVVGLLQLLQPSQPTLDHLELLLVGGQTSLGRLPALGIIRLGNHLAVALNLLLDLLALTLQFCTLGWDVLSKKIYNY
jgi:hypothetical protein